MSRGERIKGMDFAEVARAHVDDVYRFLLYLTGDRLVAEDLAADTMERAFREQHRYDPGRARPRAWLLAIARSTALDHFRREQRRRRFELNAAPVADAADGPGISNDLSAALEEGLRRLTAADREVIALRVILELDARAASRLLGVSETACTTRLSRALARLEGEVRRHAHA
jgi:RNA polymerase sigma-70 factor (ECF subfamily)